MVLVLSRKSGESIYIDDQIKITILDIRGNRARIGFEAPDNVNIVRSELVEWSTVPSERSKSPSWCDADAGQRRELTFSI